MSTRDELAELLDRIYYDYEGGYLSNEENLEYVQADALIAEGWRKKPDASEVAEALDEATNSFGTGFWATGERDHLVRAILALMDKGQ